MPTIYISDSGDDKNDGLSLRTAIYSLERAEKLGGGINDCSWHFGPRAWKRMARASKSRFLWRGLPPVDTCKGGSKRYQAVYS